MEKYLGEVQVERWWQRYLSTFQQIPRMWDRIQPTGEALKTIFRYFNCPRLPLVDFNLGK